MEIKDNSSKKPEGSPEFIMVQFDERGHPVGAKPVKNPGYKLEDNGKSKQELPQPRISPTMIVNKELIEKLLVFVDRNIESLRQEIRQSNYSFQQTLDQLKFKDQGELNSFIFNSIHPLKEKMDNIDLRISSLAREMAETKSNEMVTAENLRSFLEKISELNQEVKDQTMVESVFLEKINSIEKEFVTTNENIEKNVATINENMIQSNTHLHTDISKIEEELDRLSKTVKEVESVKEDIESLKSQTVYSINDLYESQMQTKEDLLVIQEKNIKDASNDIISRMQKMLNKPKKKTVIKPTRAKVVRFLKKNFKIKSFSKVLVVTDKRNSTFGKTLHEATRNMSQKSVLAIMEDRTNKMNLDRHVIEAIKQSNYVFVVGKCSLKKVKELSKSLKRKTKIMSIKRTLNYFTF